MNLHAFPVIPAAAVTRRQSHLTDELPHITQALRDKVGGRTRVPYQRLTTWHKENEQGPQVMT